MSRDHKFKSLTRRGSGIEGEASLDQCSFHYLVWLCNSQNFRTEYRPSSQCRIGNSDLSVLFQVYFTVRNISLVRKIKKDPSLKDPLNNELVQHNELIAWRESFFSVIGFIDVAAVVSIFVHINDLMLIFLTALLIGFGTHNATFMFWKGNMMVEKILNNTLIVQKAWKGLTQEQLAELVGVTRKSINTVENRNIIPLTYLALKLSQVLVVTVEEVIQLTFLDDQY